MAQPLATLLPNNAQQLFINGPAGRLDTLELQPKDKISGIGIIIHPDPKGGGTYTNKIVQSVAKILAKKGCICFCPNLRGVGLSAGEHSYGRDEGADAYAVLSYAQLHYPGLPCIIAGFSFGSAIAAQLAQRVEHKQLILIGPAVTRYTIEVPDSAKTIVIHGQEDEIIELSDVYSWAERFNLPVAVFPKTGHFFHGKLIQLQNYLNLVMPA
jgi:alpha/beta superfamily hydrolase